MRSPLRQNNCPEVQWYLENPWHFCQKYMNTFTHRCPEKSISPLLVAPVASIVLSSGNSGTLDARSQRLSGISSPVITRANDRIFRGRNGHFLPPRMFKYAVSKRTVCVDTRCEICSLYAAYHCILNIEHPDMKLMTFHISHSWRSMCPVYRAIHPLLLVFLHANIK